MKTKRTALVGEERSVFVGSRRPAVTCARLFAAFAAGMMLAAVLAGCAGEEPRKSASADLVLVKKSLRKMQLIKNGQVVREYRIALGDQPYGHKMQEGDERTPEGSYILDWRNPNSRFYKSIHVSYPNDQDIRFARYMGVSPGGMIMIHGQPDYIRSPKMRAQYQRRDWTDGCIAVQNEEMDEIWRAVRDGTPIRILP
jgi:murein L,D-transpeptidase YafK